MKSECSYLDLSEVDHKKILIVASNLECFTKELNAFLSSNQEIKMLLLNSALLHELLHSNQSKSVPLKTSVRKLKIHDGWRWASHSYEDDAERVRVF